MKIISGKNIVCFFFIVLFFVNSFLFNSNIFAQSVKKDTVYHTQFDTNKIKNAYLLDSKSDTIGLQEFIWSDRRNLSEILNDKAGYFINYLGVGGKNPISFNNFDDKHIGIFRDGIQINDNFFGGFDEENISISEIQKIEEVSNISSFLYGMNSSGKALNIITKDAFQPTLFSQLRYSQDRYGAMFADFSLNIPFSKKFNFIFGINSHFTDGYYQNSDFNVWRGRLKFNFYSSPKLNIKASFYHTKINRRLNVGLVYNTDDTLKNANFAEVYSINTYERFSNYYFDVSVNANLLSDKESLTKFRFYSNNFLRLFRRNENGLDTGIFIHNDFHYIQYGLDFTQHLNKKFTDFIETNLMVGGNTYFNLNNISRPLAPSSSYYIDNYPIFYQYNIYSFKIKLDVLIYKFFISSSFKSNYIDNELFNNFGIEGKYKLIETEIFKLLLKGGYKTAVNGHEGYEYIFGRDITYNFKYFGYNKNYYEFGFESQFKNLYLNLYQYHSGNESSINKIITNSSGNYSARFQTKYFDFGLNTSYSNLDLYPSVFLKTDVVYHNFFFNNKLNLKLGISVKYFPKIRILSFDVLNYYYNYYNSNGFVVEKNFFNMDFYVGARIGTANVNITVANIFDNLNYTTAIYPYDARGGFLNTVARFSIVWDFNR